MLPGAEARKIKREHDAKAALLQPELISGAPPNVLTAVMRAQELLDTSWEVLSAVLGLAPTLMPVPDSSALTPRQRRAAAALLRGPAMAVAGLASWFTAEGHELALVGGSVRDVFLGRRRDDLDLATDARPGQVRTIAAGWADTIWDTGIEFGTVGLRRGGLVCEITTYRSEQYRPGSRRPAGVAYGRSLEADLARRDFTVNAIAARLPWLEVVDPVGGTRDLTARVLRLERAYDDLERRIRALSAQELDKIRPDPNGTEIMEMLGIPPGPLVGQARRFLLELRMEHGPLGHDRAGQELRRWAEARGLDGRLGRLPRPPMADASDPGARRRARVPR